MINLIKIFVIIFFISSCQATSSSNNNTIVDSTWYSTVNLENRTSFVLPVELDEISGHTFVSGDDDIVYCVQDENGKVYAFNLKLNKIERTIHFGKDGDYEGITNDGKFFYVLKSNGTIYSFPIHEDVTESNVKEFKQLIAKGEYESLGIDIIRKELIVVCKSCKIDNKKNHTTGYLLDYSENGVVSLNTSFSIDLDIAKSVYPKFPKVFNPSAITRKTTSNEWLILSSIDKLILVTDSTFKPISVIPFSRKNYEQPEGIAFDSNENLFISSERGDEQSGMLFKID